jgi:hypothetical protein
LSHFSGHFEGASTFLTPKLSLEMAQKVIVPQKNNYVPHFLKQRDINSYTVLSTITFIITKRILKAWIVGCIIACVRCPYCNLLFSVTGWHVHFVKYLVDFTLLKYLPNRLRHGLINIQIPKYLPASL